MPHLSCRSIKKRSGGQEQGFQWVRRIRSGFKGPRAGYGLSDNDLSLWQHGEQVDEADASSLRESGRDGSCQ
jgi:hypothetical protein